jgi:hypothetical protein
MNDGHNDEGHGNTHGYSHGYSMGYGKGYSHGYNIGWSEGHNGRGHDGHGHHGHHGHHGYTALTPTIVVDPTPPITAPPIVMVPFDNDSTPPNVTGGGGTRCNQIPFSPNCLNR